MRSSIIRDKVTCVPLVQHDRFCVHFLSDRPREEANSWEFQRCFYVSQSISFQIILFFHCTHQSIKLSFSINIGQYLILPASRLRPPTRVIVQDGETPRSPICPDCIDSQCIDVTLPDQSKDWLQVTRPIKRPDESKDWLQVALLRLIMNYAILYFCNQFFNFSLELHNTAIECHFVKKWNLKKPCVSVENSLLFRCDKNWRQTDPTTDPARQ